ncbi:hypothetical protein LXL04_031561 [Taraxacum kok-saghyz]
MAAMPSWVCRVGGNLVDAFGRLVARQKCVGDEYMPRKSKKVSNHAKKFAMAPPRCIMAQRFTEKPSNCYPFTPYDAFCSLFALAINTLYDTTITPCTLLNKLMDSKSDITTCEFEIGVALKFKSVLQPVKQKVGVLLPVKKSVLLLPVKNRCCFFLRNFLLYGICFLQNDLDYRLLLPVYCVVIGVRVKSSSVLPAIGSNFLPVKLKSVLLTGALLPEFDSNFLPEAEEALDEPCPKIPKKPSKRMINSHIHCHCREETKKEEPEKPRRENRRSREGRTGNGR